MEQTEKAKVTTELVSMITSKHLTEMLTSENIGETIRVVANVTSLQEKSGAKGDYILFSGAFSVRVLNKVFQSGRCILPSCVEDFLILAKVGSRVAVTFDVQEPRGENNKKGYSFGGAKAVEGFDCIAIDPFLV